MRVNGIRIVNCMRCTSTVGWHAQGSVSDWNTLVDLVRAKTVELAPAPGGTGEKE